MAGDFNGRYILDEAGNPMPCPDLMEWALWLERSMPQRRVALDQVDGYEISTVFLGLDHSFDPAGPTGDPLHYKPVLWETMAWDVIGESIFQRRYISREDALAGHIEVIFWIRRNIERQESQLNELLAEISASVVPDRATGAENDGESPESHSQPAEVDARRRGIGDNERAQGEQDEREHHENEGHD